MFTSNGCTQGENRRFGDEFLFMRKLATAFLLVLSTALYIGTASAPALLDDDADAAHAIVAREMLQRHDYVVMYMNGIRYLIRAPLHFWMVAASYALLGESEFATRLPVALAMVALVLLTYEFGCRFLSWRVGFYGSLVVATSPGFFIFTRTMIPEAIYVLEFTAVFYLFLRAWTGTLDPRIGYWGAAAFSALAALTRGLIGVVFPLGVIVAFITITHGWPRWRQTRPASNILIFLTIAVPWHILAELRAPGFFWAYFINDQVHRALGTRWPHDYGAVPLWLWWFEHVAWFFPWSCFLLFSIRELPLPTTWGKDMDEVSQAKLLLLLWAGIILLFFSIESGSRMEYYSFGAWPAIALLLGVGLAHAEQSSGRWLLLIHRTMVATAILIAALLGYLVRDSYRVRVNGDSSPVLPRQHPQYDRVAVPLRHVFDLMRQNFSHLRVSAIIAALSLVLGMSAAWVLRERGRALASTIAIAIGMCGFVLAANLAFKAFEPQLSSRAVAMEINPYLHSGDQIALYGDIRTGASVAFYTHRRLWLYDAAFSNLEYGSRFPDAPKIFLTDRDFPAFWRGHVRAFLIVPEDKLHEALAQLPLNSTWFVAETGGKVVYVNQPLTARQLPLAQMKEWTSNGHHISLSGLGAF
jgi:4-amino-4-deoxy-L-arabinose transferase-like glycosyltransferase